MSYEISVSGQSLAEEFSVEESFLILQEAGYHHMDFWLDMFCKDTDSPMQREDWKEWVGSVRDAAERHQLRFSQLHALYGLYIPKNFEFIPPAPVMHRSIEACRMLECEKIVFHPLFYPYSVETTEQIEMIQSYNVRWFSSLLETAEQFDVEIQVENTFDYMNLQTGRGTVEFSYCSAEMLLNLIQRIGSERVKICMDTGHANIAGKNLPAMIHQFGSELKTLHINDNYGLLGPVYPDFHLFPGYGTICWEPVFQALKEVGFEGALNLEPTLSKAPHAIHVSRLRAAREIVTIMAEQAGMKAE